MGRAGRPERFGTGRGAVRLGCRYGRRRCCHYGSTGYRMRASRRGFGAGCRAEPPTPIPVPPVETIGGGFGVSPLLLGLAAVLLGAGVYLLIRKHENSPA